MGNKEMEAARYAVLESMRKMEKAGFKPAGIFLKAKDITELIRNITDKTLIDYENIDAIYSLFCEIEKILKDFDKEKEE